MIQLWEKYGSEISANCDRGELDEEFYIPIKRNDPLWFRLQIPYAYYELNGPGLPVANVELTIVDVAAINDLCQYSTPAFNQYAFTYKLDTTNRIAEYQFLAAIGFADDNGYNYDVYDMNVVSGDLIDLSYDDYSFVFKYGSDEIPYPIFEVSSGKLCIILNSDQATNAIYQVNGVGGTLSAYFSGSSPIASFEDFECWRLKVKVTFGGGAIMYFYSKPFKILHCEEESVWLEGTYTAGDIDCAGQIHTITGGDDFYPNKLMMRIIGGIDRLPDEVNKDYNSRSFNFKSSIIKKYALKGQPVPQYYLEALQTLFLAKNTKIDGIEYYAKDVQQFSENLDIIGASYQSIAIPLQSSKCENIFVC
jgi:hypothetical protein